MLPVFSLSLIKLYVKGVFNEAIKGQKKFFFLAFVFF